MSSSSHYFPIFIISPIILLLVVVPVSAHLHVFPTGDDHDSQNVTTPNVHQGGTFFPRMRRPKPLSRQFVQAHNKVRRELNQPMLRWDRNLARYARRWALQRISDCKMIHSHGPYGENAFWGWSDKWTASQAVDYWVDERKFYDPNTNGCTPGETCGHYTQVVWWESLRVGCSRNRCLNGSVLIFCEYDPPGNWINESPFGRTFNNIILPGTADFPTP